MKSFCKSLGTLVLLVGTIGGTYIAAVCGKSIDYVHFELERDWGLTIALFASFFLSSLILYVILAALGEVLENQEKILNAIKQPNSSPALPLNAQPIESHIPEQQHSKAETKITTTTINSQEHQKSWNCPNCKCSNPSDVNICKVCGKPRP